MRQRILAIDQAAVSGLAWTVDGGETRHSCLIALSSKATRGERFAGLRYVLSQRLAAVQPELIVMERPNFGPKVGFIKSQALMGYAAIIEMLGSMHGCDVRMIPAMSLKKFATGNGRAEKDDMVSACRARGWRIDSHDEADALWMLEWGLIKGDEPDEKRPKSNRKRAAKPPTDDDLGLGSPRQGPSRARTKVPR